MSQYLFVKEVANLLGMSEKWVYRHKTKITGYFRLSGKDFFDEKALLEWINKHSTK